MKASRKCGKCLQHREQFGGHFILTNGVQLWTCAECLKLSPKRFGFLRRKSKEQMQ
jgi:hypothetical protein